MKILVLGDVHGRKCWEDIVEKERADKVIFLGDYVSSHQIRSPEEQINNFDNILNFKENNKNSVILLRGNHDIQHIMGNTDVFECSGYFPVIGQWCCKNYERIMSNTQWLYIHDNILFSHAGISKTWFADVPAKDYNDINKLPPSELFGFRPNSIWDIYGDSKCQGLTWIRPQSLAIDCIDDYIQIVGHTIVDKIVDLYKTTKNNRHIYLCDCLPREYIVIDNNKINIVKNENNAKSE